MHLSESYKKRLQELSGLNIGIKKTNLNETLKDANGNDVHLSSTKQLKLNQDYLYSAGVQGFKPFTIKATGIIDEYHFNGYIVEIDEKVAEYKGYSKGQRFQFNVGSVIITDRSQIQEFEVNNPEAQPKNELPNSAPKTSEAFNKIIAWAKSNGLKTINRASVYAPKDVTIALHKGRSGEEQKNAFVAVTTHKNNSQSILELIKNLGGKANGNHMDDSSNAVSYVVSDLGDVDGEQKPQA